LHELFASNNKIECVPHAAVFVYSTKLILY